MPLKLPTPPTPPTIDKGEATESTPRIDAHEFFNIPFKHEKEKSASVEKPAEKSAEKPVKTPPPSTSERKTVTPEDMAREAVANGAGALTKKTVTRPNDEKNETPQNSTTQIISHAPATANLPPVTEKSKRGKEILKEFQDEDSQTFQVAETPRNVKINHNESYSGFYWVVMLVLVGILSVIFVRKILVKKNPPLKKSDLFTNSSERLKAVAEKVTAPKISTPKINPAPKISTAKINTVEKISEPTQNLPQKKDDGKGSHFEVRI